METLQSRIIQKGRFEDLRYWRIIFKRNQTFGKNKKRLFGGRNLRSTGLRRGTRTRGSFHNSLIDHINHNHIRAPRTLAGTTLGKHEDLGRS
jgi:hypothetical protein